MKKSKKQNNGDVILLRGALEWSLLNAQNGEIVDSGANTNTVASVGRKWMLSHIFSNETRPIDRIYLGTGTQTPASTLTALANSFSSKGGTASIAGTSADPPYGHYAASWASNETHGSSSAINEFGLYVSDTMVGYVTTSAAINFGSTNTLAVTYRVSN